jgi:hypothetical protein
MTVSPWAKRYRERHFVNPSGNCVGRVWTMPEDIERREESSPCFFCEARGPCRHRKWMLAEETVG